MKHRCMECEDLRNDLECLYCTSDDLSLSPAIIQAYNINGGDRTK